MINDKISLDQVRNTLKDVGTELLQEVTAIYSVKDETRFGENRKAATFRFVFQSPDQSLSQEDVAVDVEKFKQLLTETFAADIR